ncbi:MAG: hypothetical protein AAFR74_00065 [Pseudomonadota bacterium]
MSERNRLVKAFMAALVMMTGILSAYAAPGDILYSDNFDQGGGCSALAPWTTTNTSFGGTSTQTSNSGNCSLFTAGGFVEVTSPVTDLSGVVGADLTAWVRRGADSFSEDTDPGEDFEIQYLNNTGTWVTLESYLGSGTKGEVILVNRTLPLAALHSGFRLRVRQLAGSNLPYDFWHIDDVTITETGTPPPIGGGGTLAVNRCDDFEDGFDNWTTTNSTRSAIGSQTSNSSFRSLFTRHGSVTTTSVAFNSAGLNQITVWVRRGADAFSENPDNNENLRFQYLNASNAWVTLETFSGSGTQGQVFNRTYNLPASAQHPNFQVRFTQTAGSGSDFDYWHIDDVCFLGEGPDFNVMKTVRIEQDPVNGTTDALGIPGAWAIYTLTVTNNGVGTADPGTLTLRDSMDESISLFTGDFDGSGSPFEFIDGTGSNASGVTLNWGGLADNADGVTFFNSVGTPVIPNGAFDPVVNEFLLQFGGTMNGTGGGGTPTFSVEYRVLVE